MTVMELLICLKGTISIDGDSDRGSSEALYIDVHSLHEPAAKEEKCSRSTKAIVLLTMHVFISANQSETDDDPLARRKLMGP